MKRVLAITDSLGLPRPTPEVVKPNETWVQRISNHCELWQYSSGGATIKDLYSQIEYHKMFNPDIVIIQAGIVDCAPRALSKFENEFINKFRFTKGIGKLVLSDERLNKFRRKRKCYYTNPRDFEQHVSKYKTVFQEKLYWLGILPASDEYENKVPGIKRQIDMYNKIVYSHLENNFLYTDDLSKHDIMSDSIHLSVSGHNVIFEKVKNIL